MLTTEGWDVASEEAKQALHDACSILREAGITILEKSTDKLVADVEAAIAQAVELTTGISNWEGRWPLNTYARDMTPSQLSEAAMERLSRADAMRLEQYQPLLKKRCECREIYARLQHHCDLCLTLSAPGPAPVGTWTGDPVFAAPASMLGAPALSLPVLEAESLPLGLQTIGFRDRDAALIGFSSAMLALLGIAEPHANTAKAQSS